MKVVILCGGQGTRIRDVAEDIPKPMVKVGDRPILWHLMKGYAAQGHTDFVLCLGYKGSKVREFFLNYQAYTSDVTLTLGAPDSAVYHQAHGESDWTVTLADTGAESLTGRRIKAVAPYLAGEEDFLLTYGDGLSDVDIADLVAFHKNHGKALTVTGVRPPGRFGELECDSVGRVTEFNEKPQATGGRISGGFFVCSRRALDFIPPDNVMFEQEPMRALLAAGELMVHTHDGFWQCMDTYRDYRLLNGLWDTGDAPWRMW